MSPIEVAQRGLEDALAKHMEVEGAMKNYFELIASAKRQYVRRKLVQKEFRCEDLLNPKELQYEYRGADVAGHVFKCVAVRVEVNAFATVYPATSKPINMSILFLRNPDEILSGNKKLTDLEKRYLKQLNNNYMAVFGGLYDEIFAAARELSGLKHGIRLVIQRDWEFSFQEVTSQGFVGANLSCMTKLF